MSRVSVSIGSAKNVFRYEEDDYPFPISLNGIASPDGKGLVSDVNGDLSMQQVSINTWQRTGTTISPINAGDDLDMGTGQIDCDILVVDNGATFGGGYGSTGLTISTAGVLQANGAGTFDGSITCASVAAIGGDIEAGVADTVRGIVSAFGSAGTAGGIVRLYNGATADTETDFWELRALDDSNFTIGGVGGTAGAANVLTIDKITRDVSLANDLILIGGGDIGTATDPDTLEITDNLLVINGKLGIGTSTIPRAMAIDTTDGRSTIWLLSSTTFKAALGLGTTGSTVITGNAVGGLVFRGDAGVQMGVGNNLDFDLTSGGNLALRGILSVDVIDPVTALEINGDLSFTGSSGDIGTDTDLDLLQLTDGDLTINAFTRITSNLLKMTPSSDPVFELGHSSLTHGITTFAATDAAVRIESVSGADGRGRIWGFSDIASLNPLTLIGAFGSTTPDDTVPAVIISGAKRSATSIVPLDALETILQIQTAIAAPLITVLGDGKTGFGVSVPTTAVDVSGEVTVNAKAKITSIGGYAIKLTNEIAASGNTTKGALVEVNAGFNNAFQNAGSASIAVIGITLDSGVANGEEAWIVVSGIAEVLADSSGFTRGDRLIASGTNAGAAEASNAPAVAVHFQEIGHALETAGAGVLGKVVPHFN